MIGIPHFVRDWKEKVEFPLDITVCNILCSTQYMPHSTSDDLFENLRLELRRGCLVLAVMQAGSYNTPATPRFSSNVWHLLARISGAPGAASESKGHPERASILGDLVRGIDVIIVE